jgi:hypothetical protein
VRQILIQVLSKADPPMMSIPMILHRAKADTGISFSWNTIFGHLADLEGEGTVKRLAYQKSRPHTVCYRTGRKAGMTETRTKTSAWYQLSARFKPVEGLDWKITNSQPEFE